MGEKLSKKQKKALQFRENKKNKGGAEDDLDSDAESNAPLIEKQNLKRKHEEEREESEAKTSGELGEDEPKKKRKTRRGKKGKGVNGGAGPRFILFVGNLPYDINETQLLSHFKSSEPSRIRIRADKGIAFLEFDQDTAEIQKKMELALRMNHSVIKNRKINVELTVGGGGNSENRVAKLKAKNEKMMEGMKERIRKEIVEKRSKKDKKENSETVVVSSSTAIHPSRANLIR